MKSNLKCKIVFLLLFMILLINPMIFFIIDKKAGINFNNNSRSNEILNYIKDSQVEVFHDDINTYKWNLVNVSKDSFEKSQPDQHNYLLDNYTGSGIWNYSGISYYIGDQDVFPEGFYWDGIYWWMIGSNNDEIHKYYSNWSYAGITYDISGQCTTPTDIFWDGTNWWVLGNGIFDRVYQYYSNWSYTGISHYLGGQEPAPKGIFWDGINWWVVGLNNRIVYQYNSDWGYTGISYYIGGQDGYPSDLFWDGAYWWVPGTYTDTIYQYYSNWSYTGFSYYLGELDNYPTDIIWDGINWWMLGYENSQVYKYSDDLYNISKFYFGNGYMYMQTNTTETIALQSVDYGNNYSLNSMDYFKIDFETNSDSEIELILLKDGIINKTFILSQFGNTNFYRQSMQIFIDEKVEFNQLKISGTLEDTDYVKLYDIKIEEDLIPPLIEIHSPITNQVFGSDAPSYNITILEANLDSIWYSLDTGSTNITIMELIGTINQSYWNSLLEGFMIMKFWANDTLGNIGTIDVGIYRDTTPPNAPILLNYPQGEVNLPIIFDWIDGSDISGISTYRLIIDNEIDPFITPGFVFEINITNTGSSSSYYEYTESLQPETYYFFLWQIDGAGLQSSATIGSFTLLDTYNPLISINSPNNNTYMGNPPILNIYAEDPNLDSIWYRVGSNSVFLINNNDQQLESIIWNSLPEGSFQIYLYANDTLGNLNDSLVLTIYKDTISPSAPILINFPQGEVSGNLIFEWQEGSDPSGISKYRLIIDNEADPFATPGFLFEINITGSYYEYTASLQPGTYYYFLYQIDGAGHQSSSSDGSFTISSDFSPSQPSAFPFWIIALIIIAAVGAGVISIVVLKKNKKIPTKPTRKKEYKIKKTEEFKDQNVYLKRGIDFLSGLARYKVAIENKSKMIISNIEVSLQMTAEHVRLIDIKPKVYKKLDRALISNMSPRQSVSIDFFLEPMICGRIPVRPLITYLDAYGKPQISSGKPLDVISKCPLIINTNEENIAKIKKLYEDTNMIKAKRTFELEHNPRKLFDLLQEAIGNWAGKQVSQPIYESTEPFIAEVYYYNLNQNVDPDLERQEQIIIKIRVDASMNVASLSVASEKNETVNGILTHIWQLANEKYGNIFGKNFESLHCPFCGTSVECIELDQELITCSNCGEKCTKSELKKF